MPDPAKLKSFLERTQRAMQDAVSRGDQKGVDQYEQFLDRANNVGMRMLGQGGQGGLSQMAPSQTPQTPQLMAGEEPTSKIESDFEGETMPPPGAKPVRKPDPADSALNEILGLGKHNAFEAQKADTLGSIDKTLGFMDEMNADRKTLADAKRIDSGTGWFPDIDLALEQAKKIQSPPPDYRRMAAVGGGGMPQVGAPVQEAPQAVADTMANADNGFLATLGGALGGKAAPPKEVNAPPIPETNPEEGPVSTDWKPLGTPETTGPSSEELYKYTQGPANPNAEAEKAAAQYGEEPKFFSLHRLAQILLTGAPSAVRSFDQEKAAYEGRKFHTNERMATEKRADKDQSWRMQVQSMKDKVESQKAMATLLPHAAREQARPYLQAAESASKRIGDMMRMIPPPPPEDPRWGRFEREYNENLQRANEVTEAAFKPLNK